MESRATVLVVDDEASNRDSLRRIFERAGYDVLTANDGQSALNLLSAELDDEGQKRIDIVLTDLIMPRLSGMEFLKASRELGSLCDVVLMTAYGTVENAVLAMREGAYDFITKPVKRAEVLAVIERCLERRALLHENRTLKVELEKARGPDGILGTSENMRDLLRSVRQVAPSDATVLIKGESGTGKELVARALHRLSPRAENAFVAVNCAALPETILEAELFGAEKGAYTGAVEKRIGRFERAQGGTLLLDEVGDIPLSMQVKLLRVLQEGEIERLGGKEPVPVDVRLLAATHKDLKSLVAEGLFREDLYYRLNVIELEVPALRQRHGDIPLLATSFLRRFANKYKKSITEIDPACLQALSAWHFPGNVRELENAIERAVVLSAGETLKLGDLPSDLRDVSAESPVSQALSDEVVRFVSGQTTMEQLEQQAINATLLHTEGNKPLAAKLLGISIRTLYRRLDNAGAVDDQPDDE